jgi:hypothetical protein
MRISNFTLLAVLSYVAVIGATPLGARAPAEANDPPHEPTEPYVVYQRQVTGEVLTRLKILSPAQVALTILVPTQTAYYPANPMLLSHSALTFVWQLLTMNSAAISTLRPSLCTVRLWSSSRGPVKAFCFC